MKYLPMSCFIQRRNHSTHQIVYNSTMFLQNLVYLVKVAHLAPQTIFQTQNNASVHCKFTLKNQIKCANEVQF